MKTTIILAASLVLAGLSTLPAHAATGEAGLSAQTFANRCLDVGGQISADGDIVSCLADTVTMDCAFIASFRAECRWDDVSDRATVAELLGYGSNGGGGRGGAKLSGSAAPEDADNGGWGGIDLPDLPIKWK
jgi:hypothetical protein